LKSSHVICLQKSCFKSFLITSKRVYDLVYW
jgi:hypothetical protein